MKSLKKRLLIFMLLIVNYTISSAEVIKIPPIIIDSKKEIKTNEPINILLNLKKAIAKNQEAQQPSKEQEAKEILERLKESIHTQTHQPTNKSLKKIKKSIKKKTTKRKTTKKNIKKKNIKKKHIKKKIIKKRKTIKKNIKKKITKKDTKVIATKDRKAIVVSKRQNIKLENSSPESTEPIGFVKTLGVVGKSEIYEANDLVMDKREEINNDGVIDIATATTDELKELPFVKPLEVIEVTKPFEASEAKKYKLDKY